MEGWRSKLGSTIIHVHVDGQAGHKGHDGGIKESQEDGGGHEGDGTDQNHWAEEWRHLSVVTSPQHDVVKWDHVSGSDGNLSEEDEHLSDQVGEGELQDVLDVQEETVPGGHAEVITGDGHVSISRLINVIADLLNAGEDAGSNLDEQLNCLVVAWSLLSLLGQVNEDDSAEKNESDASIRFICKMFKDQAEAIENYTKEKLRKRGGTPAPQGRK